MKSWYAIADMLGAFVLIIIMLTTFGRIRIYNEEYNETRLSKAVEYSTEAAFAKSVRDANLDVDYKQITRAQIYSKDTYNVFKEMMCLNYGLALSDSAYATVEESVRGGVLAANDGYYVLTTQNSGKNEQSLMWSPKLPYTGEQNGYTVSYDLEDNDIRYIDKHSGLVSKSDNGASVAALNYARNVTGAKGKDYYFNQAKREAISENITNDLAYSVNNNDKVRGDADFGLYIPSTQIIKGVNALKTPSLMFLIQGTDYTGELAHNNVAFTGMRVIPDIRVLGYEKNGKKLYAYEFQGVLEDNQDRFIDPHYYKTPEKAADEGYIPDYDHIFNRIDYDNPGK